MLFSFSACALLLHCLCGGFFWHITAASKSVEWHETIRKNLFHVTKLWTLKHCSIEPLMFQNLKSQRHISHFTAQAFESYRKTMIDYYLRVPNAHQRWIPYVYIWVIWDKLNNVDLTQADMRLKTFGDPELFEDPFFDLSDSLQILHPLQRHLLLCFST